MIGIRVDANGEISLGHLMRCLSIAEEARGLGSAVVFLASEEETCREAEKRGYRAVCLRNDYREKDGEIGDVLSAIGRLGITCLLVDSYEVTGRYMEELNRHVRTAYIDDMRGPGFRVDALVHSGLDVRAEDLSSYDAGEMLLGSGYVPLRREFRGIRRRRTLRGRLGSVFLSAGGSDRLGMVRRVLDAILGDPELNDLRVNAILGRYFEPGGIPLGRYEGIAGQRVTFFRDVPDIWNVMDGSDIAVSAGGGTVAELCCAGIPTIDYVLADNQEGVLALRDAGVAIYAGDVRDGREKVVERVLLSIKALNRGDLDYEGYSQKGMEICDGLGAVRIAECLRRLEG